MVERNEDVLKMIAQLQARLLDLENDVRAFDGDLPDMAKRLDHIDDRIYLFEREIESRAASAAAAAAPAPAAAAPAAEQPAQPAAESAAQSAAEQPAQASAPAAGATTGEGKEGDEGFLTPRAKEELAGFADDLRGIATTGAQTLSELNDAFGDIAGPLKKITKGGKRRRW